MFTTNQFSSNPPMISGFLPEVHSYGFNGKELDKDNIVSGGSMYDFGNRMYSPSLARFISIDQHLAGSPMRSGYVFASNFPLIATDIGGDSTWVTLDKEETIQLNNGDIIVNKVMTIHLTVSVLDLTGKVSHQGGGCSGLVSDLAILADQIESGFNEQTGGYKRSVDNWNGSNSTRTVNEIIKFDVTVNAVEDIAKVSPQDHLLCIVDEVNGFADQSISPGAPASGLAQPNGQIAYSEFFSPQKLNNQLIFHRLVRTCIHELGHNLGFRDHEKKDLSNAMSYGSGKSFNNLQLSILANSIYNSPENFNKGENRQVSQNGTVFDWTHKSTNDEPWSGDIDDGDLIPTPLKNEN